MSKVLKATADTALIGRHVQYYAVSFNSKAVGNFLKEATKILFKWLNRRSQRKSFDWGKFMLFKKKHPLPKAKIHHTLF